MNLKRVFVDRRRIRLSFILVIIFSVLSFIWIYYNTSTHNKITKFKKNFSDFNPIPSFNIDKSDVLVFLHIQKTGGSTFGKHLVNDLNVNPPCSCSKNKKRCECLNKNGKVWIFSRSVYNKLIIKK